MEVEGINGIDTLLLKGDEAGIKYAGELLAEGKLVGLPTETVYGLAADALNREAVEGIFRAKGRPGDNPLIVHIDSQEMLCRCVNMEEVPEIAMELAKHFWPGPLTLVLPRHRDVPLITTGGLETVGVRMPGHPLARRVIEAANRPLAAPSANISGSPSPTSAEHVMKDLYGRISAVLDGGACAVGLESTVVSFNKGRVRILRPGFITAEDIENIGLEAEIDEGVLVGVEEGTAAASPGMKYKHYAPKAATVLIEGSTAAFAEYMSREKGAGVMGMLAEDDFLEVEESLTEYCVTYGSTPEHQSQELFMRLRQADEEGVKKLLIHTKGLAEGGRGLGLAVYNRLLRAAGFEVVKL